MSDRLKAMIDNRYHSMARHDFQQWFLEWLCTDINDTDLDKMRLNSLRYVSERGYLY